MPSTPTATPNASSAPAEAPKASHVVAVAIRAIFERWTALRLVVEHQHGGAPFEANEFLECTIFMATNPDKRYVLDDYIDHFYDMFEHANTDIEDGSPEEVAALILRVRDAAAVGNFGPAQEVVEKADGSADAFQRSVQSTQDDDPEPRRSTQQAETQPTVDDDGFTTVPKRRGRRR